MSSVLAGGGFHRKLEALDSNKGKTNPQAGSQPQNDNQRRRERTSMSQPVETVVVAVNAAKEITKHALEWALTNVVQPGDHITLLALWPSSRNGRKLWGLPKFAGDCANGLKKGFSIENLQELEEEINDSCSFVMQQLHKLCDAKKVKVSVKVVKSAVKGAPAMEAQRAGATWVVLDRQLKKEGKSCMEQLDCNLVVVNRHSPKILRLNLRRSPEEERMEISDIQVKGKVLHSASDEGTPSSSPETGTPFTATEPGTTSTSSSEPGLSPPTSSEPQRGYAATQMRVRGDDGSGEAVSVTDTESDSGVVDAVSDTNSDNSGPLCRTASVSPKQKSLSSTGRCGRSFDTLSQPWFEISKLTEEASQRDSFSVEPWKPAGRTRPNSANATPKLNARQGRTSTPASPLTLISKKLAGNGRLSFSMREGGSGRNLGSSTHPVNSPVVSFTDGGGSHRYLPPEFIKSSWQASELSKAGGSKRVLTTKELLEKFSEWDQEAGRGEHTQNRFMQGELERTSSVRKAMSLSRHVPAGPPPLCSICQHKAPVFGKPPRRFTYAELELATGSFSNANFLAEGGFGSVHRGVLPDGQAVAVKQHKLASSQGDIEFCSEVEVLSCAQHRNVVMLIGYCIEEKRRLLVYEFICNGSLDSHLYGRDRSPLEWPARQTIAVGAAKGLRYLHEECRVGCIVHRDMRPNNILLTHDFEPMVGDFGLARWQPDGDLGVQTRVIGTFGYLAPEYAQSGQITEKADVYSFGVVLLELVTGRKAVDINRPKGQQCLTEWARPLLDEHATQDLIDPRLEGRYSDYEVYCMLHGASLCIRRDPHLRPRMSQVLRILEGDIIIDTSGSSTPSYSGKLAYDHAPYGSRSSRISSEYVVNRLGTLSPPLISYSGSLAAEPRVAHSGKLSMCAETLVNYHSSKLSYEALKAAYKDRANSRRLSYEDMMRISEN